MTLDQLNALRAIHDGTPLATYPKAVIASLVQMSMVTTTGNGRSVAYALSKLGETCLAEGRDVRTPPRTMAFSREPYRTPSWPVRPGAEDHKQIATVGLR